jgi:phosphatidylserine/phosphatidylglycerophosphate/cardiolipin synthase-like enzyme
MFNNHPLVQTQQVSRRSHIVGTITFQNKFWAYESFPKHVMHKSVSTSGHRSLSHAKLVYADDAWRYLGSHNCTESAWGSHGYGKGKGQVAKLDIRNYEDCVWE